MQVQLERAARSRRHQRTSLDWGCRPGSSTPLVGCVGRAEASGGRGAVSPMAMSVQDSSTIVRQQGPAMVDAGDLQGKLTDRREFKAQGVGLDGAAGVDRARTAIAPPPGLA